MEKEEFKALQRIVDYLIDDERRHWEESEKPKEHIYMDVLTLAQILEETEERGLVYEADKDLED